MPPSPLRLPLYQQALWLLVRMCSLHELHTLASVSRQLRDAVHSAPPVLLPARTRGDTSNWEQRERA